MKSIFHSEDTVRHDGTEYRLEADQTIEGTPFLKVTNLETEESDMITRRGSAVVVDGFTTMSEDKIAALESHEKVSVRRQ